MYFGGLGGLGATLMVRAGVGAFGRPLGAFNCNAPLRCFDDVDVFVWDFEVVEDPL